MSVAYRVIKNETEGGIIIIFENAKESFNMSGELLDFLISNSPDIKSNLDELNCGLFKVPVIVLKQAINEKPWIVIEHGEECEYINLEDDNYPQIEFANLNLNEYVKKSIKEDIEFAEKNGDDYVMYYALIN